MNSFLSQSNCPYITQAPITIIVVIQKAFADYHKEEAIKGIIHIKGKRILSQLRFFAPLGIKEDYPIQLNITLEN